jgi:hypothetical protein
LINCLGRGQWTQPLKRKKKKKKEEVKITIKVLNGKHLQKYK